MNIITNAVAPISAVVPRSTSVTIRTISGPMIRERNEKALHQIGRFLFLAGENHAGEKKDHGHLRELGRLKRRNAERSTQRREPLMRMPMGGTKQKARAMSARPNQIHQVRSQKW